MLALAVGRPEFSRAAHKHTYFAEIRRKH